jgi:hypothetical protein
VRFVVPEPRTPAGHGQNLMLPVLVMTLGFSRFLTATMLPSRQAGDLLADMWQLINALGKVPKTLIWDRESAIGGKGGVPMLLVKRPVELFPRRVSRCGASRG